MKYRFSALRSVVVSIVSLVAMGPWTNVLAFGSGHGFIDGFKAMDSGANSSNKLLAINIDTVKPYVQQNGMTMSPGFYGYPDLNGICTSDSLYRSGRAALVINNLADPVKKTFYTMLMSAELMNKPVKLSLGNCIKDNIGAIHWEITAVEFP